MTNTESAAVKSPKPPLRVRVAVVAASVVFALLVFELFLRAVNFSYPTFYRPDAVRGYALEPGAEGWQTKEGRAYVRVNSDGLRDREHEKRKPAGVLRVAVLGDSYAEALQVAREDSFPAVLERALGGCQALAGREVEVINFGVSGYGTAQELLTLRGQVWDYSPDVVLLAVTTNNDVTDNVRAFKDSDEMPYFLLRGDRLVLDDSFREGLTFRRRTSALESAGRWLHAHLRFVQALYKAQQVLRAKLTARRERLRAQEDEARRAEQAARARGAGEPPPPPPPPTSRGEMANMVYLEPPDEEWRGAWRLTERLVLQMRGEVEERGAKFFVATLSNPVQVHPEPALRAAFLRRMGPGADLFYPDRRFEEFGRREGLAVFTLAPELQAYADEHKVFLHGWAGDLGNGHWNENGHRVAGELLARKMCERLTP